MLTRFFCQLCPAFLFADVDVYAINFSERSEGRNECVRGETGGQVHGQLIYKGGRKLSTMTLRYDAFMKELFIK